MSLLRAVATVGGYTMMSRVLGFVRDALTASALGAGGLSDAFVVAQRLPNMFRSLFAEGAFSAAFVPVFARRIEDQGRPAARIYAEQAMSLLLMALLLTLVLGEVFMPWLIPLIAAGFTGDADQLAFTTKLTRITFPYLLFISLVALLGGVLNSLGRFAAVAATPVLLNLFMIAAVFWGAHFGHIGEALSWGTALAGLAQFLWLMGSCARDGMALRLPMPRFNGEMRSLVRLMGPGVFGAGVTQINLLVSTNVASLLPAGSMTYLYYADRLNQLPLAVVGIAIGTAILPELARNLRIADGKAANLTQNRGLELALLLTLPAAAALAVIAQPILAILFERGHFTALATVETGKALCAYALGLPAFVLVKVLAPAFYARQDTATPVKIGMVAVGLNLVLTLVLSVPLHLGHVGNALATTSAGWVNALALAWFLRRRGHFALDAGTRRRIPRILAAALAMALLLALLQNLLAVPLHSGPFLLRLSALGLLIAGGMLGYAGFVVGFGAGSWAEIKGLLRRRRPKPVPDV